MPSPSSLGFEAACSAPTVTDVPALCTPHLSPQAFPSVEDGHPPVERRTPTPPLGCGLVILTRLMEASKLTPSSTQPPQPGHPGVLVSPEPARKAGKPEAAVLLGSPR